MLLCGPLSDRLGRRGMLLGGIALFALSSLACALAASVEQLIAARLLQALGGGAAYVLARAVARDLFPGAGAIRILSLLAMVTAIAPLVAPLAGSALLGVFGWRATFGALLAWAVLSLGVVWTLLPESLPPPRRVQVPLARVFGVYRRLLADRAALGLLMAGGLSFAAMFAYITAGPFFFIELHGFTPSQYSVAFAANAFGIFLANFVNRRCTARPGPAGMMRIGCITALAGALVLLGAVPGDAPMPVAVCGFFAVVSMTGLLGANGVGLLMARFPNDAGAAAALFGAAQFGFGTLASVAVSLLHDGSGRPMAMIIAAACALAVFGQALYRAEAGGRGRVSG
jgi:DHA1 family bicyclomycin/chloramphenicol resistance-like MFS transporter